MRFRFESKPFFCFLHEAGDRKFSGIAGIRFVFPCTNEQEIGCCDQMP